MASKENENKVVGRFDFPRLEDGTPPEQNNIQFSFENTDEATDLAKEALISAFSVKDEEGNPVKDNKGNLTYLHDFDIKDLTPRNRYGRQGKPLHIKIAEAQAETERLLKMAAELRFMELNEAIGETEDDKLLKGLNKERDDILKQYPEFAPAEGENTEDAVGADAS